MAQRKTELRTKLSALARAALPALMGGLLWSYLAAAMVYGALQA